MDGITKRELALAQLKAIQEQYQIESLDPMINQIEQFFMENRASRRVLKKFEIGIWPPRITLEWEFAFKK